MKNRNIVHKDDWATPPYIYDELNKEFNFDYDPCPYQNDITKFNGLETDWGKRNFINPPYSRKLKEEFVRKAILESKKGKLCVMLLPVSTSTVLFHDHILPNKNEIRFFKRRIKFCGINTFGEYTEGKCGMHDSMLVVFDGRVKSLLFGVGSSVKVKINEPFEIEETCEKYVCELNNFIDKDGLWDIETVILKAE